MNKFIWMVAVVFSLVFGQSAFASSERGCVGEGIKKMVESLKLEAAQKEKIRPILEQLRTSLKDNVAQMPALETQLSQQVGSDTMDQATVDGLVEKKAKLIANMMKAKIMAKNQIFTVLNTQQKAQLHNMMKGAEEKIAAHYKSCHEED